MTCSFHGDVAAAYGVTVGETQHFIILYLCVLVYVFYVYFCFKLSKSGLSSLSTLGPSFVVDVSKRKIPQRQRSRRGLRPPWFWGLARGVIPRFRRPFQAFAPRRIAATVILRWYRILDNDV